MAKPFIKWVGGKRQLIPEIEKRLPKKFNNYIEPFIGGGALLFYLKPFNAIINDYNPELTNVYSVVKNSLNELVEDLKTHENNPEYYYKIRSKDRNPSYINESEVKRASRFIYLNKTGFNGLYRVNRNGEHNVPFANYENPKILDEENLNECSHYLKNVQILNGDFEKAVKENTKEGDFIYFDPPYVPINTTSSFTSYTDQGFDEDMQIRLKELCEYIDSIGGYFLLSNSDTDLVRELYKNFKIDRVLASRSVNSDGEKRGKVYEVLVKNY
ncbi:MAG: DNA adenine methylase [Campylobacterales bacterium]|nr:DNA adenine methylase [Campylobacterales bacterium]